MKFLRSLLSLLLILPVAHLPAVAYDLDDRDDELCAPALECEPAPLAPRDLALVGMRGPDYIRAAETPTRLSEFEAFVAPDPATCKSNSSAGSYLNPECFYDVVVIRTKRVFPAAWVCEDGCSGEFNVFMVGFADGDTIFVETVTMEDWLCNTTFVTEVAECPNGENAGWYDIFCDECE